MEQQLKGKTAVITGGGGILCGAIAKGLAADGVNIALLDLNKERADAIAAQINADGGNAAGFACNVLDLDSVKQSQADVLTKFGDYDILINGAGGNNPKASTTHDNFDMSDLDKEDVMSFFDLTKEGFDFVFSLNIMGSLLPTQVFAKRFAENGKGNILNISSMNAYRPLTRIPAYSAAKAGISNFTQWLAVHFAPANIRVNAIAPGFFLTEQNRTLLTNPDGSMTARSEKILRNTPMNQFGVPEDLIGATEFLVDDAKARFITGVILPIDGGFSAYSGV